MHLKKLKIENFRGIENIEVEFDGLVNVIIGPNAVGKTTLLEAIRLNKALLAPRIQSESNQVLLSLGAYSQFSGQFLFRPALTNKPSMPLIINCTYSLKDEEIEKIKSYKGELILKIAYQYAGISFPNPSHSSYLSSPQGLESMKKASEAFDSETLKLENSKTLELNLTIGPDNRTSGEFLIQQIMFAALDQMLDPYKTLFSYFPADRALPTGEQPMQLGLADTAGQLESYNSQPHFKYMRLKNAIFGSIIRGENDKKELYEQFAKIFGGILKGRKLGEIGINEVGMLSIQIQDIESKAVFQIEGLSSGEKGLILTFLLIARNMEKNGIVLLDEPELHLNPAVCQDLLQFFVDEYAIKKNIQGIICSHSAEILAGAFEREQCSLYHLRGSNALAKVRQQDRSEIREALKKLGSSESEALLYKGTVTVEGIHDVEILQIGFGDLFRKYKIKELGGRKEVEKAIQQLQRAESEGGEIGYHYFIFDHDRKPTSLSDSTNVKLLQLNRFCLENYLLDEEILTDLSQDRNFSDSPKNVVSDMLKVMKDLYVKQLNEFVARSVFKDLGLEKIFFEMDIMKNDNSSNISIGLWEQIKKMKEILENLGKTETLFFKEFNDNFNKKLTTEKQNWYKNWKYLCNGKQIFEDLRMDGHFKGDLLKLKKAIVTNMRTKGGDGTETYNSLKTLLRDLIS